MDAPQRDKLKALADAATPGPWQWWTSNSTLRLTGADGRDGGVLYGYVHSGDGDVYCSDENRAFIEAADPRAISDLLADRDAMQMERDDLRAEVERLRAELAAGASRQGGITNLDGIPKREWWLIEREGDDEYVKVSDVLAAIRARTTDGKENA